MFNVSLFISTKTGLNPAARIEFPTAAKAKAGAIISSPLLAPKSYKVIQAAISASVPLLIATLYL